MTTVGVITISPTTVVYGAEITITGSNFSPNTQVEIKFDNISVRTFPSNVVVSTTGTFVATFDVPAGMDAGAHTVSARDDTGREGLATYTITGSREISLSPASGRIGTIITVSGSGFSANKSVTIKFDDSPVTTNPSTVTTTSTGTFSTTLVVPSTAITGSHTISAVSNGKTTNATFDVTLQASQGSINLSSTTVGPGSSVTVSGSGFNPNSGITFMLDGNILATSMTNSEGSFTIIFNTPADISAGSHSVSATDGPNTASALISIIGGAQEVVGLANLKVVDQTGLTLSRLSEGIQVLIQSDLKNNLSTDQKFAYIVQVKDSRGVTVMISWMSGTLPAGKQYAVAQSWLIEERGRYSIDIFTWESLSNPVVLAPSLKTTVDVL
ncbi:MAG: IPT/TIG domain-containing protein [Nitrososphaerales archaeon]